ncbi:hypothetical protein BZG36_01247 [Bifiguratus adelaidae]|uniref:polynucleotide adenylyltransferase n=1 Tax=Bifiguratus adelaidae TaxID=1938954 RepID=A0A261Y5P6_9FUNG|nr:hypothetical protein BZG36_01247 [Bifiguratus adelaidae]
MAEEFIGFEVSDDEQRLEVGKRKRLESEVAGGGDTADSRQPVKRQRSDYGHRSGNDQRRRQVFTSKLVYKRLLRDVPWCAGRNYRQYAASESLTAEIHDFVRYVGPTEEEHVMRQHVIQRIEGVVKSIWPNAELFVFGSYDTKLYLPTSDIDLVLICTELMTELPRRIIPRLSSALSKEGIAEDVKEIINARVPILKFTEKVTKYKVDVSFNMTSGLDTARITQQLCNGLPGLRELVLVIKWFLAERDMNEVFSGGLGSYAVLLIVASFLQLHPRIQEGSIDPRRNLGPLLVEFFELYGTAMSWEGVGIRVGTLAHPLDAGYYDKRETGRLQPGRASIPSIEDPGDADNDVSRGSFAMPFIKKAFFQGFEILRSAIIGRFREQTRGNIDEDDTTAMPKRSHTRFDGEGDKIESDDDDDDDDIADTILGQIISMPVSIQEDRHNVHEIHQAMTSKGVNLLATIPAEEQAQNKSNHERAFKRLQKIQEKEARMFEPGKARRQKQLNGGRDRNFDYDFHALEDDENSEVDEDDGDLNLANATGITEPDASSGSEAVGKSSKKKKKNKRSKSKT